MAAWNKFNNNGQGSQSPEVFAVGLSLSSGENSAFHNFTLLPALSFFSSCFYYAVFCSFHADFISVSSLCVSYFCVLFFQVMRLMELMEKRCKRVVFLKNPTNTILEMSCLPRGFYYEFFSLVVAINRNIGIKTLFKRAFLKAVTLLLLPSNDTTYQTH